MNWLDKWFKDAKHVILDAEDFFENKETSESLKEPVMFLLTSMSLPIIIAWLIGVFLDPNVVILNRLAMLLVTVILLPIFYILWAGIVHIGVVIMGGDRYRGTFDALIYPTAINFFIGWIPLINIFALFYVVLSQIRGIEKMHDMTLLKSSIAYIVPLLIITVLLAIAAFFLFATFSNEIVTEMALTELQQMRSMFV